MNIKSVAAVLVLLGLDGNFVMPSVQVFVEILMVLAFGAAALSAVLSARNIYL